MIADLIMFKNFRIRQIENLKPNHTFISKIIKPQEKSLSLLFQNNFCVIWNRSLVLLIKDIEKILEMIVKWLKKSGLVVNESKTEICLFHSHDQPQIKIKLQGQVVLSKNSMNVLGADLPWGNF